MHACICSKNALPSQTLVVLVISFGLNIWCVNTYIQIYNTRVILDLMYMLKILSSKQENSPPCWMGVIFVSCIQGIQNRPRVSRI